MTPSWRKPAGVGLILVLIAIWCVAVATFSRPVSEWHWIAQALFYLVAGTAWILPLKPLLVWMELGRRRPDTKNP